MSNGAGLTKRHLPVGDKLAVLLRVASVQVCQKLRKHLQNVDEINQNLHLQMQI